MTCFFAIPALAGAVHISYHFEEGYCWAEPHHENTASETWDKIDNYMDAVWLAVPVILIIVSCLISTAKIQLSNPGTSRHKDSEKNSKLRRQDSAISVHFTAIKTSNRKATITIIIVTILYIIFNIPLFVNYVLYVITILKYTYPGPIYSGVMHYYSWNITALLSTALNSSANPVVYFTRFKRFRQWFRRICRCEGASQTGPRELRRRSTRSFGECRRISTSCCSKAITQDVTGGAHY